MNSAKQRSSTRQSFSHSMPAYCNYKHLKTFKTLNTAFFSDIIIKKIFLVEITADINQLNQTFTNPTFRLYTIKASNQYLSGDKWPQSKNLLPLMQLFKSGVNWRSQTSIPNKKLINTLTLKTGELFVFLISVITKDHQHASAAIVHKNRKNEIEFFVLEPHGEIYDYHKKIAKKYFNVGPNKMYLPFDEIQDQNYICVAHSKALIFEFLKNYKRHGNVALQKFRTSKTTFSTAPVLKMGGSLGRPKSGRITDSIGNSSRASSAKPRGSLRSLRNSLRPIARIDPVARINSRNNLQLFFQQINKLGWGSNIPQVNNKNNLPLSPTARRHTDRSIRRSISPRRPRS